MFSIRIEEVAAPKVQYVTELLGQKGKWVDVGCGVGEIVAAAERIGWEALGLEIDEDEIEFAHKMNVKVKKDFLTSQNAMDYIGDASVVSFFNVVEHLVNPYELLGIISNSIPDEAYVVIEIPRHPSLSSFANRAFPNMAARHIYPPDHLHIFTEKSAEILLRKCGLIPSHLWLFGQDFYEVISSMSAESNCKGDDKLLESILQGASQMQEAVDKSGLSDIMIIISQKTK